MQDMWQTLEAHTQGWKALDRQAVADGIWADYVTVRFAATGDLRALSFLYPYLNKAGTGERLRALTVAGRVFHGQGPKSLNALDYITRNTDPFIRDRAVTVVGAAVAGCAESTVLDVLTPYLTHGNRFIQRQAIGILGKALAGTGSETARQTIERVAETAQAPWAEVDLAIARLFCGIPTKAVYQRIAKPAVNPITNVNEDAVAILIQGTDNEWFERAYQDVFAPYLRGHDDRYSLAEVRYHMPQFTQRSGIGGLVHAVSPYERESYQKMEHMPDRRSSTITFMEASVEGVPGRAVSALQRMLPLRHNRCTGYALLKGAPQMFIQADTGANRPSLLELVRNGDPQEQRIAALCLGRLMMGSEDEETVTALRGLLASSNPAVRTMGLHGLAPVLYATCDEELRSICLEMAQHPETAEAAMNTLGVLFLGSGRYDVFADIRTQADRYRGQDRGGRHKHHYPPTTACYRAAGLIYQGTGSMEPVDFLLQPLQPSPVQWSPYRWEAGRALVVVEYTALALRRALGDDWIWRP